ncbi:O-antigen ligase family protein [Novosphingobium album (ex Hu et al. 2023)]|uniref:O-antigen ligase family protein n=1 Tax=Novosphingobium album (ex Hu et al. 2023) TaxID=2930093 RepID=A0ABT0B4U3_9SPHN|nr:O-antigen ligase family protein [Novosphingobium album (ex Hu et al. 2023)]MCJ2180038.1 O-antigen ligase family protein [Novosphingobium album (ex Hu et al. 2023)]
MKSKRHASDSTRLAPAIGAKEVPGKMAMQRTVQFQLRPSAGKKRRPFTLSGYHAPEPGALVRLAMHFAVVMVAAGIGLAVGGLPSNLIVVPLLPLVALTLVIIWVLPENSRPPTRFMGVTFFAYFVAVVVWPYYLAIQLPGLPLIEIRRLFIALSILGFLVSYSISQRFRQDLLDISRTSSREVKLIWIFVVFQALAVVFSVDVKGSIPTFVKNQLGWTAVFFIVAYVMSKPGNMDRFANIIRCLAVFLAVLGYFELRNQGLLWANHIPWFLKVSDPAMQNLLSPMFRAGEYRVAGPFSTSLSYAEFMAMTMPFFLHAMFEGKKLYWRAIAVLCNILVFYGILLTQARVGIVGALTAHGVYFAAWTIRKWQQERTNIIASVLLFVMPLALVLSAAAVLTVPRLRIMTLGGGEHAASTAGRVEQMKAAIPLIIKRPVVGYGPGEGAGVLGYRNPAGELSIDSYILAAALNYGLLGFIVMAAMYGMFAFKGVRVGQASKGETSLAIPAATGIAVWLVAKIVLAQEDNVSVVYMFMGVVAGAAYRVQQNAGSGKSPAMRRWL